MYGSIFRFQITPGKEAELAQLVQNDAGERERLKAAGLIANYVFKLDKGGYMGVAVFESREKYQANANDPAQDRWYRRFRAMIEADPEWNDGEIVSQ